MAVMLDNFASSQQRALQAMREKCNRLKKKNETLEEFINASKYAMVVKYGHADILQMVRYSLLLQYRLFLPHHRTTYSTKVTAPCTQATSELV